MLLVETVKWFHKADIFTADPFKMFDRVCTDCDPNSNPNSRQQTVLLYTF